MKLSTDGTDQADDVGGYQLEDFRTFFISECPSSKHMEDLQELVARVQL